MPYVNIRVAGNLSQEQKEKICAGVTGVLVEVANKPASSVLIFIDEVPHQNIAAGGKQLQPPK
ncbi:4-oxalocrotonate tautomerase family protein [Desulfurivibrio sp. D14AmB]|uniref:tautomerase family protein n=1 Tax=Desulfurivibrio sp. D14AmB TaxID=3374370 RepID=UPI00376EC5A8